MRDRLDGVDITPQTIGLSRFNEFNKQAEDFIAGSERLRTDDVHVAIKEGSYVLKAVLPIAIATALEGDLKALQHQDSLGEIDPKRAEVISKWQARSKGDPDVAFEIRPQGMDVNPIELNVETDYRVGDVVPWVKVEKYLFGMVTDMGGVNKANVHIRLEDTGQIVVVGTNQDYLKDQEENRLYHKVLVRVEAEQHFKTGQLRKLRLLSFEDYEPRYDEAALDRFAQEGRKAWADVPDAGKWVRELRGGS